MRMGLKQLSEPFRTTHFPIAVACLPDTVGADGDDTAVPYPVSFHGLVPVSGVESKGHPRSNEVFACVADRGVKQGRDLFHVLQSPFDQLFQYPAGSLVESDHNTIHIAVIANLHGVLKTV